MNTYGKVHQGYYRPINPEKWNSDKIKFLSNWERLCYIKIDQNSKINNIVANAFTIPYNCATDHKMHRYYMDVLFKYHAGDKVFTFMIEIKPSSQIFPPKQPKKKTGKSFKTYLNNVLTYTKNMSKWTAAQTLAQRNGWTFLIMTDNGFYTYSHNQVTKISNLSIF